MKCVVTMSICGLALLVGCGSTKQSTGWNNSGGMSQAAKDLKNSPAGLPPATQAANSQPKLPGTVEEHVSLGQNEIASWYGDQQPHHLPKAKMEFEAALRQSPQCARAHHGLAIVADLEHDFAEAERRYQLALAQSPNDSDILGDLGYSYLLQGRLTESEQYSMRAVQANPSNRKAAKHLGDAYARQGKTREAEEAYARVLPPGDVQKALAENGKQKSSAEVVSRGEPKLLDKLIPGKSPGEKLADDIQRRYQEYEEKSRQLAARSSASANGGRNGQERLTQEEILKRQLAAIDREPYQQAPSGPIMIDDQTGQITRLPGSEMAPAAEPMAAAPFPGMSIPAAPANGPPAWAQQENTAPPGLSQNPAQPWGTQGPPAGPNDRGLPPSQVGYAGPPQYAPQRPQNAITQPWNGIQPASGVMDARDTRGQVEQAHQQIPAGTPQLGVIQPVVGPDRTSPPPQSYSGVPGNADQAAGNRPSSVPPSLASSVNAFGTRPAPAPVNPASVPMPAGTPAAQGAPAMGTPGLGAAPGNSFDEASKAAARMGMGLGPGTMFPIFSSAAPVNPPGSMSYDNSQAPPRMLPTDLPPPDLSQAYRAAPTQMTTPAYEQGGQLPPSNPPMYGRDQFGTASRYDTMTLQNTNVPQSAWTDPNMQQYQVQQWEAGRQMNQAVQQVWAQGPVNMPVSPSAGSVYSYPAAQGQVYGRDGVNVLQPPDWPYQPANMQASPPTPTPFNPQSQSQTAPQYGDAVMVPPQYQPVEWQQSPLPQTVQQAAVPQSGALQPPLPQGQVPPAAPQQAAGQPGTIQQMSNSVPGDYQGWPLIRPATRQ